MYRLELHQGRDAKLSGVNVSAASGEGRSSGAAWGLYMLIVVSGVSCISGYSDEQKRKKGLQETPASDAR